jgi:murein DD-endopeptidase MepM/ murein hydrolase activator NlpD
MRSASLLADHPKRRWSVRNGRTVTLRRRSVLAASATFLALATWSAASAWYFVTQDEVVLKFLELQAEQRRSYEDKLLALRTRLDEVSSQRMVEQEVLETRLQSLIARQAALESRHNRVQSLADRAGGPIADRAPEGPTRDAAVGNGSAGSPPRADRADPFRLRARDPNTRALERRSDLDRLRDELGRVEHTVAALEAAQRLTLQSVANTAAFEARRFEGALRQAGLDPTAAEVATGGTGGPLVPAAAQEPFDALALEAEAGLDRLDRLRRTVRALPFGEPIRGEIDLSSGFGYRLDPFTRGPAMHTGLDFRAEYGAPARAAGAGRVVVADFSGAYGNMVEIEHAQGVTSRYAHLSAVGVTVGQEIKAGAVLGRIGSTGRSTGPHLHYEVRLRGEAVDPNRFLKAGASLSRIVTASR